MTITDSESNNYIGEWDIIDPVEIFLDGVAMDPFCNPNNGASDGHIDVFAFGGTEEFTYEWNGPGVTGSNDFSLQDIGGGTYEVTVTDSNGCTEVAEYTLVSPDEIVLDATIQNVECIDGQNQLGSIDLEVSGGNGDGFYIYFWDINPPQDMDEDLSDLEAGTYSVTVGDVNNCTLEATYEISGLLAPPLEASAIGSTIGCVNGQTLLGTIELNVAGGVPPYNFIWTGDGVDPTAQNQEDLSVGDYAVTVSDSEGCQFSELNIEIVNEAIGSPSLCLVTNDNPDGYNTLYWEDPTNFDEIGYYNIYREGTSSGQFDLIGTVDFSQENEFFDTEANSTQQAYRYYLTAANSCGEESEPSDIHKTIHLTINQGSLGNMNLIWDEYDGITYDQVVIFRGDSPQTLEEYVTLPGNVFSYTDSDALSGDAYYQIIISTSVNCETSPEEPQKLILELKSNVAGFLVNNVEDVDWLINIFPNPFQDVLVFDVEEIVDLQIYDYQGKKIFESKLSSGVNTISTNEIPKGTYIVRLISNGDVANWRGTKG